MTKDGKESISGGYGGVIEGRNQFNEGGKTTHEHKDLFVTIFGGRKGT